MGPDEIRGPRKKPREKEMRVSIATRRDFRDVGWEIPASEDAGYSSGSNAVRFVARVFRPGDFFAPVTNHQSLAAPSQGYRTVERICHRGTRLLRSQICRFQLKIPAGLAIGVVDQHHARLHFQARLLSLDDVLILGDEALSKKLQEWRYRKPAE